VPATRVFRRAGILDDIRAISIGSFPTISWRRVADGQQLAQIDMSCVKDDPDRMTILQLGEIIKIMYRHCQEKGNGLIDVRFEHRVMEVGQDEGNAWVDVEVGKEKNKTRMYADYVVGCDGATSAVRHSLFGRNWPGQTFGYRFIVQNVSQVMLCWDKLANRMFQIFYDGFEKYGWVTFPPLSWLENHTE